MRAHPEEVTSLLSVGPDTDVSLFLQQASILVDEELGGSGLSDSRLALIEAYLAAHFAALALEKGPLASVTVSDAKDAYHNVYFEGLGSTRFGQQALLLDSSGRLSKLSTRSSSSFLGKAEFRVV